MQALQINVPPTATFDLFGITMADGMNHVRAIRISELIDEFRSLQHQIAQINTTPSEEEKNGDGYRLLQECSTESQRILSAPFAATEEPPDGDSDKEKEQLQKVMLDAALRRFQAQRIYLRATAAMRWINARNVILQDGPETPALSPALRVVTSTLRSELASISDVKVLADLLANDRQQGKWIEEDPSLQELNAFLATSESRRP